MSRLLSAEFVRLFKSAVFRLCLLFSAGLGACLVLVRWLDEKMHPEVYGEWLEYSNANSLLFVGGIYLIFAFAVLIGIFVGTEYSDGTIRNKLTVGHMRESIYLSKLLVCFAANVILHILYILVVLGLGSALIGGTTLKAADMLRLVLAGTAAVFALTAVLLLLSMSIQSKAVGAVACLIAAIVMLFATISISGRLNEPEYYEAYTYINENGEIEVGEREKNPNYLTGMKREIYEFLHDFLPVSQLYRIAMCSSDGLGRMAVYDGVIVLAATGAGAVIFRKKNLK